MRHQWIKWGLLSLLLGVAACKDNYHGHGESGVASTSGAIVVMDESIWISAVASDHTAQIDGEEDAIAIADDCEVMLTVYRDGAIVLKDDVTRTLEDDGHFTIFADDAALGDDLELTIICDLENEAVTLYATLSEHEQNPEVMSGDGDSGDSDD